MKDASKPTSLIKDSVSAKSSSVSEWKPLNKSVVIPQSGIIRFIAAILSKYHSLVYFLFMSLSIRELPDWTGKWICLQILE